MPLFVPHPFSLANLTPTRPSPTPRINFSPTIQIVAGILGGYFGLYLVFKGVSAMGGKKEAPTAPAAAPAASSSAIPSVEDENFGKWIEEPLNLEKLVASIEK